MAGHFPEVPIPYESKPAGPLQLIELMDAMTQQEDNLRPDMSEVVTKLQNRNDGPGMI